MIVNSVNRAWQKEECGPLVQFIGTKRSGMSMEFVVERSVAKEVFDALRFILYQEPCTIKFPNRDDEEETTDITGLVPPPVPAHPTHYVHFNGGAHFVKEADFFAQQGGMTADWGKAWRPVWSDSIEGARTLSMKMEWENRKGFIRDTAGNYGAIVK